MKTRALSLGVLTALILGLLGCGDDHHGDHSHGIENPSCQEISEACHSVDMGTGTPHECHRLAHDDEEEACAAQKADCVAACEAVP